MTKIALLPDLHLGRHINAMGYTDKGKSKSQLLLLRRLIGMIAEVKKQEPDLVIIPGDIFDTPNPDTYSFINFIIILRQYELKNVVIVAGNHDFPKRPKDSNPVEQAATLADCLPGIEIEYLKNGIVTLNGLSVQVIANSSTFPDSIDIDEGIDVVIGHFPVVGPREYEYIKPPELNSRPGVTLMLGDCHRNYNKGNIFYSGVLDRMTFGEAESQPGFWLFEFDQKTRKNATFITTPSTEFTTITQDEYDDSLLPLLKTHVVKFIGSNDDTAQLIRENVFGFIYQKEIESIGEQNPITTIDRDSGLQSIWEQYAAQKKIPPNLQKTISDMLLRAQQ